jgi:hypothetical protein
MLSKLLKYEIRATSRIFLPMYALLIVFALINKFFISVNSDYLKIPMFISMSVFVIIIVGICVMTLVVTIQRFNKNLLSDEGYLSFTLPVKAHAHIDAKMIISLMWVVLSVLVSFVSIFVMAMDANTFRNIREFFAEVMTIFNSYGPAGYVIAIEGILLCLIATLSSIVTIYAAITIGNMSSKHKLLVGIGSYLGFGVIEQIVMSILITSFGGIMQHYFESLNSISMPVQAVQLVLLGMIIFLLVFGVAYYFLTNWMLKKKLNLE